MTEGSPPTNFIFTFQSKARKRKTSCVRMIQVVSAVAACQSFSFLNFITLYILAPLWKSIYVSILFFHIHKNLTGPLNPIHFALMLLWTELLSSPTNLQQAWKFKAHVIQRCLFCDVRLGTMFARVDAASLQLAVPELFLKLAAVHVHLKTSAVF